MNKILLFISKNSVYFAADVTDFKQVMKTLSKMSPFEVEVIDVAEKPELAEKYKIDALPTLVINERKYIGSPTADKAIEVFEKESKIQ